MLRRTVILALLLPASLTSAHHRQTPPIVAITTTGDATLPRLAPPARKAAAVVVDATVTVVNPFRDPTIPAFTFDAGSNGNPSISSSGRTVAWDSDGDPLGSGVPGTQVLVHRSFVLSQAAVDATGTSANPSLDVVGLYTAFESTGDLAGTGNPGARQIFLRHPDGTIHQMSTGSGSSRNPSLNRKGRRLVFDATSDPVTGLDTGVPQIWITDFGTGLGAPITAGTGASTSPSLSNDGRLVVFESTADLAGDGDDTGTPQVYAYDTTSRTFARVTNEPGGCTRPAAARIKRDWRIAYLCGGAAHFTMLRANQRWLVATPGGDTTRIVPQADAHFMLVATTANLLGPGTTSGHRVYMVNLYARPPLPVAGGVTWFPTQGIPPL